MRRPAPVLVVDAAIFIAAVMGRGDGALVEAAQARTLITTNRAIEEASRRISLGMNRPDLRPILDGFAALVKAPVLAPTPLNLAEASDALRDAVPSRNGSTNDAHILALAWNTDADIWSTDRDFAGTGVASWSTPNLLRALRDS